MWCGPEGRFPICSIAELYSAEHRIGPTRCRFPTPGRVQRCGLAQRDVAATKSSSSSFSPRLPHVRLRERGGRRGRVGPLFAPRLADAPTRQTLAGIRWLGRATAGRAAGFAADDRAGQCLHQRRFGSDSPMAAAERRMVGRREVCDFAFVFFVSFC